jgi:hypothetical protein
MELEYDSRVPNTGVTLICSKIEAMHLVQAILPQLSGELDRVLFPIDLVDIYGEKPEWKSNIEIRVEGK